ncbi:hypothetical protein Bca4012_083959 [Brassica carinata]
MFEGRTTLSRGIKQSLQDSTLHFLRLSGFMNHVEECMGQNPGIFRWRILARLGIKGTRRSSLLVSLMLLEDPEVSLGPGGVVGTQRCSWDPEAVSEARRLPQTRRSYLGPGGCFERGGLITNVELLSDAGFDRDGLHDASVKVDIVCWTQVL